MNIKVENRSEKKTEKNIKEGIALALSCLAISVFLYLTPAYFKIHIITKLTSIIFGIVGIIGLSIELNKLTSNEKKIGLDNLGIGLGLGTIWVIIYYYYPIWWVNLLTFPLLFLASYGIIIGLIGILNNIFTSEQSIKTTLLVKLPVAIAQICGFILTVLQLMQIVNTIQ